MRLFSVIVRTTCSGAPSGMLASISKVSSNVSSQQTRKVSNHFIRYLALRPYRLASGSNLYRPVVTLSRQAVEQGH